ncbi:hypothetical protein [Telluria beijingensis]|uniref:hypothetical protein n=1 Tax=Telluria beijingensis TaxID=3068633 RepID=UPI002795CA29|nr:hypothetical protein [Massilia sp. REN29]
MPAAGNDGIGMELEELETRARASRDRLLDALGLANGLDLLDRFLKDAPGPGRLDSYKVFTPAAGELVALARAKAGESGASAFLRAAILHGLADSAGGARMARLPPRVHRQQLAQFRRILAADDAAAPWLRLDHDLFHKEFGIATLRLYVAGARLVDPRCGVPRSLLARGTPLDWLRCAAAIATIGGFRPYFQIHTHQFMLEHFNEEGSNECYRCCAELYALHPEVLGMFGSSWFYDPALATVSPRLAYLREVPTGAGAQLLYVATGGEANANALSKSPTRRSLHEAGRYVPRNYMLIWGRRRQQAWARSQPAFSPQAG